MAPSAQQALSILRDGSRFEWYVIPFLLVVIYVYFVDIGKKDWRAVCGGLAFWAMDWHAEIWNAVIMRASGYAPLWGTPGKTAYQILVGLNIEISLMFLIMGIAAVKVLPADRSSRILGVPNRLFISALLAVCCILVEIVLNAVGALTWEYWWWSTRFPFLLFLVAYWPLFLVAFHVYDMETTRRRVAATAALYAWNAVLILIFGVTLGWI